MPLSVLTLKQKQELAELVRRHQVVYEVNSAEVMVDKERRQIGFELHLYGTHGQVPHPPTPGCEECAPVRQDLMRIAEAALPLPGRESRYEIEPFRDALLYARARESRPDVELIVRIRHGHGDLLASSAECQSRCLQDIVVDLRELGIKERRWEA